MPQRRLFALPIALLLGGCQTPMDLGSSAGEAPSLGYTAVKEVTDSSTLFAPRSAAPATMVPAFPGGTAKVQCGSQGNIWRDPFGTSLASGTSITVPLAGPTLAWCPSGSCADKPLLRGVGGPNGDFIQDFFARYAGTKGPDPSLGYNNFAITFSSTGLVEKDLSGYRGVIFWARGHGNFAVSLVARSGVDGAPQPLAPAPYTDWNFYLARFGGQLAGDEAWKEVVIYFSDMVQEYGLATDLTNVQRRATGLLFDQQAPVQTDFRLDLDYVRLF